MQNYKVIVDEDKTVRWYDDKDQLHRLDGPAIEYAKGYKEWYVEGQLHRLDGPAIECADGSKAWYVEGQRHRLDGPAIECADGDKEWWVKGELMTEEEFNEYIKPKKTITYTVSRLTKPWALKGTESMIRALSGKALDGFDIKIKINKKPKPKKRGNNKKFKKL